MAVQFVDLAGELWKTDILYNIEGLEVSSLGRLRRQPRWVRVNQITDRLRLEPGRILSCLSDKKGYLYSSVSAGKGRSAHIAVHRAVCAAFHGRPTKERWNVCHISGDPADNRAANLRWGSHKENENDKRRHDTLLIGERHQNAKLTNGDARKVRQLARDGVPYARITEDFGVSPQCISAIKHNRTWQHLL